MLTACFLSQYGRQVSRTYAHSSPGYLKLLAKRSSLPGRYAFAAVTTFLASNNTTVSRPGVNNIEMPAATLAALQSAFLPSSVWFGLLGHLSFTPLKVRQPYTFALGRGFEVCAR